MLWPAVLAVALVETRRGVAVVEPVVSVLEPDYLLLRARHTRLPLGPVVQVLL